MLLLWAGRFHVHTASVGAECRHESEGIATKLQKLTVKGRMAETGLVEGYDKEDRLTRG
jgi:hypothetical protein